MELANAGIIVESRTINNRLLTQGIKSHRLGKKPRLTQKMMQARYQRVVAFSKLDVRGLVQSKILDKD